MIFVGVDVASKKHDVAIIAEHGEVLSPPFTIENSIDGFKKLHAEISSYMESDTYVHIGLEDTGIYSSNIRDFLCSLGFNVYMINPILTHHSRMAYSLRNTKTDKLDCLAICRYITYNLSHLKPYISTLYTTSELKSLSRLRINKLKESNVLCPSSNKIDKRTLAYQRRKRAISNSTEVMFQLLDSVKNLPAKYVLFDSWFAFPKTICNICKRKYDVICMIKISSKIHYGYQGEWIDVKKLYSIAKKSSKDNKSKNNIIGSINACIRESKDSQETKEVKIVFVKDRQSNKYLAILSTDITLTNEEIIRIYGKRWDVEVFFKMCKSYLALSKEFQGRSYDMMTAHTTIVFMRYIMLSVENRNSLDNRTIEGFFYDICDELQDINFTTSLMFLLDTLKQVLSEYSVISESLALEIIDNFFNRLPSIWKHKLQSCA